MENVARFRDCQIFFRNFEKDLCYKIESNPHVIQDFCVQCCTDITTYISVGVDLK